MRSQSGNFVTIGTCSAAPDTQNENSSTQGVVAQMKEQVEQGDYTGATRFGKIGFSISISRAYSQ
ncbi:MULTISPECIES: hypothetical protein [unclassified Nostoc]|uniref:hypothetical protein n=1 Tax=unclassified Nostoc TaxID=2593658 RepID=UPI00262FAADE|nr:hypothetical protein [Nostoc sp. S13]MDF5739808.1 hypothetical protein [Nostoc sp. S13]